MRKFVRELRLVMEVYEVELIVVVVEYVKKRNNLDNVEFEDARRRGESMVVECVVKDLEK